MFWYTGLGIFKNEVTKKLKPMVDDMLISKIFLRKYVGGLFSYKMPSFTAAK